MQEGRKRIHLLDELRGFAIICMIVHHTLLDIGDMFSANWATDAFNALCAVQPLFWAVFIIISGVCSRLSRNTVKRGVIVLALAGVITLVTAVIMPRLGFEGYGIWFGILHCLGSCMVITGLLMPLIKRIDYRVGAVISAALFAFTYGIDGSHRSLLFGLIKLPSALYKSNVFSPLGFYNYSFESADYFPILPWIFVFLFGAFIGQLALDEALPKQFYVKHSRFLSFVGKNSLWVYMAHQPVIYGVLWVVLEIIVKAYT